MTGAGATTVTDGGESALNAPTAPDVENANRSEE